MSAAIAALASDRLAFTPGWNFTPNSDYVVPVGRDDLTFTAGLVGKRDRIPTSLDETTTPVLDEHILINDVITYRDSDIALSAFLNNLFSVDDMKPYSEKTPLTLAGLTPADVGILGDRRRYGVRVPNRF